MKYEIENTASGVTLGTYDADSEEDAIEKMARDAGYKNYKHLQQQVPNASRDELNVKRVS